MQKLLDDKTWSLVEPLLPEPKVRRLRYTGRKPLQDRLVLDGILYVLVSGIRWQQLPQEKGWGSGMSCLRRLRYWQRAKIWDAIQQVLANQWCDSDRVDWRRVNLARKISRGDALKPSSGARAINVLRQLRYLDGDKMLPLVMTASRN